METPVPQMIGNHAGEACVERIMRTRFSDREVPLLAMREVSPCNLDSAKRRHDAFNRLTGSVHGVSVRSRQQVQESKMIPETAVWEQDTILRKRQQFDHYVPIALENPTIRQVI
jgi:hypothetical protein